MSTPEKPTAKPPAPAAAPRRSRRLRPHQHALRSFAVAALLWLAALGLLVGGLLWTLRSEPGSRLLLQSLPGVEVEHSQGPLLGDFSARRLSLSLPGLIDRLELLGLRWQDLTLSRASHDSAWFKLHLGRLQIDRLTLVLPSSGDDTAPQDLSLPVELELPQLHIGELINPDLGSTPLKALQARLHLGDEQGRAHTLTLQSAQWDQLQASGSARQATGGDLMLKAELKLSPQTPGPRPWHAQLQAQGPLKDFALNAQLTAADQVLNAQAQVQPFAAWPLGRLQAQVQGLNLAALSSDWPRTALSGEASLKAKAWDQAALAQVQLRNTLAGAWDQGRLPLLSATLDLQASPERPEDLQLRRLDLQLGTSNQSAGRLQGEGAGQFGGKGTWQIKTQVSDLQTALLDTRLAPLRLNGRLQLQGQQDPKPGWQVNAQAQLDGQWLASTPAAKSALPVGAPVQVSLDGSYSPQQVLLRQLSLSTGAASATAQGSLNKEGKTWHLLSKAQLKDFDPRLWWAGPAVSDWQRSPQKLNAQFDADVQWPDSAKSLLSSAFGQARLSWSDSLLMGMPLSGDAQWRAAEHQTATARVQVQLDGSQLQLDGLLPPNASELPRWQGTLVATDLRRLKPLLGLMAPQLSALSGQVDATFKAQGHWPAMNGEATLVTQQVQGQWGGMPLKLGRLEVQLKGGTQADDGLMLALSGQDLALRGGQIERLQARAEGSWTQHRLSLDMSSGLSAPGWLNALMPGSAEAQGGGSLAQLRAQGSLSLAPLAFLSQAQPLRWTGRMEQLLLQGKASPSAPAWLSAKALEATLEWGSDGHLATADLRPGRIEAAGVGLRWSQARWRAARFQGEPEQLDLQAELEPLTLAPLLARWQPDYGWGGDLQLDGQARLHLGAQSDIELTLQRRQGDLIVTDDSGPQGLGLREFRLKLSAQQGQWRFSQAINGSNLGKLNGSFSSRVPAQRWWPQADAPLSGQVDAEVANLGTWGGWVPAGWRVAGAMGASLQISGTMGKPQLSGWASGQGLSVRNLLEGVDVREGDFLVSLNGPSAKLERFTARAGKGTVHLDGTVDFSPQPQLQARLQAQQFTVLGRVDRRLVASGQAQLSGKLKDIKLNGQFTLDEGLIDFTRSDAPALEDDVTVLRQDELPTAQATPGPKREATTLHLDLGLDLGQKLRLRGRGLDTALRGQLRIGHQNGKATLSGTVKADNGTYKAYGQVLDIERGEVSFQGAIDNPRLDVIATRPNADHRVGVTVTGSARNPRIRLFSEPELSETEKLSWLVLGRGADGLGRADTALLQRAALALLAGEGEGVSGKLIQNLGLDELSIKQSDGDTKETIVRLGKQLSRRWYVGWERGLNSTTANWQLIYRIAQRFTLRAQSGADNALDLIWQWKWN